MQSYQRYIGAAFQMLVTILGGVYLGVYLDGYFHTTTPWFTLFFSLASIVFAMLALIKSLPK
jgi:F0F1-type ATP synthase assembly protein I